MKLSSGKNVNSRWTCFYSDTLYRFGDIAVIGKICWGLEQCPQRQWRSYGAEGPCAVAEAEAYDDSMYSVSQGFLIFSPQRLAIFSPNFTCLSIR